MVILKLDLPFRVQNWLNFRWWSSLVVVTLRTWPRLSDWSLGGRWYGAVRERLLQGLVSYQALCMRRWCCPLPMVVWKLFAPWKFALEGGVVQRRLSSRGSCWSRPACGSSAVVIRGLVIESRASFQDSLRGWQPVRPVSPILQFMLGMGERLRWGGEVTVCLG